MKKIHILGILVIAIAVMVIISTAGDASSYVTFAEALRMAGSNDHKKIHVVGKLKKDAVGNFVGIEPSEDHLSVSFIMVDNNQQEQKIFYREPMPPDLLKSDQVVVVGAFREGNFVADKVLLKCPSKYQEEKLY
jgi:cytochrome c-type biogenesis protein CcmE